MASSKAQGEKEPEANPQGCVEDVDEPRTKIREKARLGASGLGGWNIGIFTILLAKQCHDSQTDEQIVDRMGENGGQEASGLFVDPSPEQATPTHTQ